MSTIKKAGVSFYAKVDTDYDLFNQAAGFSAEFVNDSTGAVTAVGNAFSEIIRTPGGNSATVSNGGSDVLAGAKQIPCAPAGLTLVAGDVFNDGAGNMYYIESVDSNVITTRKNLVADIADITVLNEVGNTGVYRVEVSIPTAGDYTIIVRNATVGMQNIAFPVSIIDEDLDDAHDKLDDIAAAIGVVGGRSFFKGFV